MHPDVVGDLLRGQAGGGGGDQLQRGKTPRQGLRARRTVAGLLGMAPSLTDGISRVML